ncbi:MAG: hypothetical protein MR605_04595 [Bacteroidales bacterium]|nr:hypothetical protein [Bacteroidales bacterium]
MLHIGDKDSARREQRKEKPQDFIFFAEPQPMLWKDSARREQRKEKPQDFIFFAEPQPMLWKDSARREQRKEKPCKVREKAIKNVSFLKCLFRTAAGFM